MSYWSSGIGAEDRWHLSMETVRSQVGSLLGELCMVSTEVLCAATSELGNHSTAGCHMTQLTVAVDVLSLLSVCLLNVNTVSRTARHLEGEKGNSH